MSVCAPSPIAGVFRQGEIVSELIQVHVRSETLGPDARDVDFEEKVHPYALILTQDCDLDWDFRARTARMEVQPEERNERQREENRRQAKLVPTILFCELTTTEALRPRLAGGDVLRRIRTNLDERYHCLAEIPLADDRAGEGLPELVADFKRVFCIPTDELYARLALGTRRRAFLQSPHLQHLGSRFGYYCLRVALPEEMPVEVPVGQVGPIALPPPGPEGGGAGS